MSLKQASYSHTVMYVRFKLPYFTLLYVNIYEDRSFYLNLGEKS